MTRAVEFDQKVDPLPYSECSRIRKEIYIFVYASARLHNTDRRLDSKDVGNIITSLKGFSKVAYHTTAMRVSYIFTRQPFRQ